MGGMFTARRPSIFVLLVALLMLFGGNASAAPDGPVAHSLQLATMDITVTGGSVSYGPAVLGSCVTTRAMTASPFTCIGGTTVVAGQSQSVRNNGTAAFVSVRYDVGGFGPTGPIFGANCDADLSTVEWTASQSGVAQNVFRMDASMELASGFGGALSIRDDGNVTTISDAIPTGVSRALDFRLHMPTASTFAGPCSVTTRLVASVGG